MAPGVLAWPWGAWGSSGARPRDRHCPRWAGRPSVPPGWGWAASRGSPGWGSWSALGWGEEALADGTQPGHRRRLPGRSGNHGGSNARHGASRPCVGALLAMGSTAGPWRRARDVDSDCVHSYTLHYTIIGKVGSKPGSPRTGPGRGPKAWEARGWLPEIGFAPDEQNRYNRWARGPPGQDSPAGAIRVRQAPWPLDPPVGSPVKDVVGRALVPSCRRQSRSRLQGGIPWTCGSTR